MTQANTSPLAPSTKPESDKEKFIQTVPAVVISGHARTIESTSRCLRVPEHVNMYAHMSTLRMSANSSSVE